MARAKTVEAPPTEDTGATAAIGVVAASHDTALVKKATTQVVQRTSKLPSAVQLPLVIVLSFALNALAYSFLNEWTKGELADVATQLDSKALITFLAWRAIELAIGWYGNYDSYDLAALNLLSHGPTYFLLSSFYGVSALTAGGCLAIDSLASFLPFLLLRPLSGAHTSSASVPNRDVISDRGVQVSTTLLAGLVYSATLFVAFKTVLATPFVLNFPGIARVEPALDTPLAKGFVASMSLLFGAAARSLIFTPATAATEADVAKFDPVAATLGETLRFNLLGHTARAQVAVARTFVVAGLTWVNTYLQTSMTVAGVEAYGAAVYASAWALAAVLTGVALELVGET